MAKRRKTIHEGHAPNRDFIAAMWPLFIMAFFYYGPRVPVLALVAAATAKIADRAASLLRGRKHDASENSSIAFALVITLMLPVTVQLRVVVMAVLAAVFVGKEAFGGFQSYPFNPAAVGFCVAAISWPDQVYSYPAPIDWPGMLMQDPSWETVGRLWNYEGIALSGGPSAVMKAGGLPTTEFWNLVLGNYAGAMGISYTLVILACALYLMTKKRLQPAAPAAYLAAMVFIAFVFPRFSDISFFTFPQDVLLRLQMVKYEMLAGGAVFSAVFLVTEPGTLPKNRLSQLIYGGLLGISVMMFRYFGNYTFGNCFGFLLVNAVSGYFDRAVARGARRREVPAP